MLLGTAGAEASGPYAHIINTPTTVMSAGGPTIRVNTALGPRVARCATITVDASIGVAGGVRVAPGDAVFAGCLFNGVTVTITQPVAWSGTFRHLHATDRTISSVTLDLVIPAGGIHVAALFCRFDVSGALLGAFPLGEPHGPLADVPAIAFPAPLDLLPLDLVVADTSGICADVAGIVNGQAGQLTAAFAFDPFITGAGVV